VTIQQLQPFLLAGAFVLLWLAEAWQPHHARAASWWRHTVVNLLLNALYVLAAAAFALANALAAAWTQTNSVGLLYWLNAHPAIAIPAGILVLDLAAYGGHILKHKIPLLWRFHRVHHSDAEMDVTTGFRFHPIEALISWVFLLPAIVLFGVPILSILIFAGLYSLSALAQHANFALPEWADRIIRIVFVSPGSHRIHHSPHRERTDSNYASLFSFWDRLFGTYKTPRQHVEMQFGLSDEGEHESLRELLVNPFVAAEVTRRTGDRIQSGRGLPQSKT
jgi:sterol desaturase/sphingolipid hydroxylase (fatty acid hydroxylase superfamily)